MKKEIIINAAVRAGAVNAVHHDTLQKAYGRLFQKVGTFMVENPRSARATLTATTLYICSIYAVGGALYLGKKAVKAVAEKCREMKQAKTDDEWEAEPWE